MEKKDDKMTAAEFKALKNGPLQVSGNFILKSSDMKVMETRDVIFLCRCGASGNKPFCDGSHRRTGLKD